MQTLFFQTLSAAAAAAVLHNAVFTGGLGITEAVRLSAKQKKLWISALFVAAFSLAAAFGAYFVLPLFPAAAARAIPRFCVYAGVLAGVYAIALALALLLRAEETMLRRMRVCALNTMVLAVPYLAAEGEKRPLEIAGAALGAAAAFAIAMALLRVGAVKLGDNPSLPPVFRGSAALLIYAGILALAFAGLSGAA